MTGTQGHAAEHSAKPALPRREFVRRGLNMAIGTAGLTIGLASCGDDKPAAKTTPAPTPTTAAAPSKQAKQAAALGPELPGIEYPAGYLGPKARKLRPFTTSNRVFTVVTSEDTTVVGDWNKNKFTKWMAEQTGLKVKFQTVSTSGGDMTKVNAMIASGDLPDAFLSMPFSRDQISLYGRQGIFAPLDDLISRYAPRVREAYDGYPDLKVLAKSTDGKTYAIPGLNDCYHCRVSASRTWINKNFLDTLGAKMPETTDDFRALLKLMKDKDASGHGDTMPLAASITDGDPVDRYFMSPFMYNPGEPWLRLDDEKVDFVANKPQWREGLRYLRSLYDDGTMSSQLFTMTREALVKLGSTPGHDRLGVIRTSGPEKLMDLGNNSPDARWRRYVPLPPLKGPKGVRYATWDYYQPYQYSGLVVTKNCANPELLVQWADFQMDLTATMGAYAGTKGDNWWWSKKGAKSIMGKQATWNDDVWPAPVSTSWNQYSVMYRSNDFRLSQEIDPKNPTYEANLYEASRNAYEPYRQPKKFQLPPLIFDQEAAATNADTALALKNHVELSMAQFATGKLDINDDGVWKTYLDKIDKIGLSQYLANYQRAYDAQMKG